MSLPLDRRRFLQFAAAGLVIAQPNVAEAQGASGCCILPQNANTAYKTLFNKKPGNASLADWQQHLNTSSGINQTFENELGKVLADLSREFSVVPGFGFYDDGNRKNAIAVDKEVVRTTNGMIAFGRGLLAEQLSLDPTGISIAAICAHEFAHIYQYRSGYYDKIEARYPGHVIELHADFLAGAYLHHLEKKRPGISLHGVGRAWEDMGSSTFNAASTHGSNAMRLDSIQAGYFWVDSNPGERLYNVASAGVQHVRKHANG